MVTIPDIPRPAKQVPPLLEELFRLLPAPGKEFSREDRVKWLKAFEATCDLIYAQPAAEVYDNPPPPPPPSQPFKKG